MHLILLQLSRGAERQLGRWLGGGIQHRSNRSCSLLKDMPLSIPCINLKNLRTPYCPKEGYKSPLHQRGWKLALSIYFEDV